MHFLYVCMRSKWSSGLIALVLKKRDSTFLTYYRHTNRPVDRCYTRRTTLDIFSFFFAAMNFQRFNTVLNHGRSSFNFISFHRNCIFVFEMTRFLTKFGEYYYIHSFRFSPNYSSLRYFPLQMEHSQQSIPQTYHQKQNHPKSR